MINITELSKTSKMSGMDDDNVSTTFLSEPRISAPTIFLDDTENFV